MMLNTDFWSKTDARQKLMYKIIRHPLTILFGYLTIFIYGMCAASFARNPRKNWDSALSVTLHIVLITLLWSNFGFATMFFTLQLPLIIATAMGAYLFYAQHNFPDAYIQPRETWSYARAALESSSYMKMGPVMNYFTGNIGYHHVHHLTYRIPFYRLPEAMAGIPELQNPRGVTSLHPRDIMACFQLKIWDPELGHLTDYPEALDAASDSIGEVSA
jgi:omega-6 fatty acid desaturase (delta-12 desaturase)